MNKSAVAMAADSAVTISGGRRGIKTYDTVNKLFELIKGVPVGVMVYANAELSGMPWETIIKSYREERREVKFDTLEEYAENFTEYLSSDGGMLGKENDEYTAVSRAHAAFMIVFAQIKKDLPGCLTSNGRIIKTKFRQVIQRAIDKLAEEVDSMPKAPWADGTTLRQLKSAYEGAVLHLAEDLFENFELTKAQKSKLVATALESLRRSQREAGSSGLVVAGFGQKDYFPKVVSSTISGRTLGVLRATPLSVNEITISSPGHLETFAQDEMAWGFLSGINERVRKSIMDHWSQWIDVSGSVMRERISKEIPELTPEQLAIVEESAKESTHERFHEFLEEMQRREEELYLEPIWQSIAMLPKDELGVVAESLVNLTSLKQRMSIHDAQTVGGPIDVALISRGDGFVWIKRKHYFSPELNPAWHLTHHGNL